MVVPGNRPPASPRRQRNKKRPWIAANADDFATSSRQYRIWIATSPRSTGSRNEVRSRIGPGQGRYFRGHVCQRLDTRLRRPGTKRHSRIPRPRRGRWIYSENRDGGIRRRRSLACSKVEMTSATPAAGRISRALHSISEPAVRRVLVVDDEESIRNAIGKFLKARGYDVAVAVNGAETLETLQRERFDALLYDVRMPGMSGTE